MRPRGAAGTDKRHPEARLTLLRADELPLQVHSTAFRTRYGGEDCVQINLSGPEDEGLSDAIKRLPWRQYLSVVFLVLFTVLPSTLLLKLDIDNAPAVYLPDDQPANVVDRALHKRFPNDQVFVAAVRGRGLVLGWFFCARTTRSHGSWRV